MSRPLTMAFALALGLSTMTQARAQMANTREGTDARDTPRAANTARSGRAMPPGRGEAPSSTGSTDQKKGDNGPDLPGICIGCAK